MEEKKDLVFALKAGARASTTSRISMPSSGGKKSITVLSVRKKYLNGRVVETTTPHAIIGDNSDWVWWTVDYDNDAGGSFTLGLTIDENTTSSKRTGTVTLTQDGSGNIITIEITQEAGIQLYSSPLHVYIGSSPQGNTPYYRIETQDPFGGNIQKGYVNGQGKLSELEPPRMTIQNSIVTVNYYRAQVPGYDYLSFKFKQDNGQQLSMGEWNGESLASGVSVNYGALGYVIINNFSGSSDLATVRGRVNLPGNRDYFYVTIRVIINPGSRP